jgi:hypothetical protein
MIKRYCDACGEEMTDTRVTGVFGWTVRNEDTRVELKAKVITAVDGTWNGGHLCTSCIRDIVQHGEEVPE